MENSVKNNVRPQNKNLNPPMKKGETINPNGRPKGQRNYATIYREALLKIAQIDKITPEDLENDMIAMAVKKARKGDPIFYKDIMDRIHGKPVQPIGGDKNNPLTVQVVQYVDNNPTTQLP